MTTPRVYKTVLHNTDYNAPCLFEAEVILLSDHKEVVRRLEDALKSHPHSGSRLEDYMKIDDLEAIVKRQAIAIEKLREQRDEALVRIANGVYCPSDDISEAEEEITAILQEAK